MSEMKDPKWDALPHDPQAFFALVEGFDRRDLKRSYSTLIRVYKPERHPEEFQRIRAAYEQLDRELRYGRSQENDSAKPQAQGWEETPVTNDQKASEEKSREQRSAPEQLVDRVVSESPQAVYDEISERAGKSPYDYYSLAILSDLLKPRKTTRFSRWLIKGVEAHPFEPNLLYLLREDLARSARVDDLPTLLEASAKAVPRDDYFALTEPAWERLLRVLPFERFIEFLENCEQHLRDISIGYRLTFMMRVLRHAIWSDQSVEVNRQWVETAFRFVEENFQQIPDSLEMEVEFLSIVGHYATLREQFLTGNSQRKQMDEALKQYLTAEAAVGDQAVLDVQLEILADPQAMLEAFPSEHDDSVAAFYNVWAWAATDVGERYGTPPGTVDARLWERKFENLLHTLIAKTARHRSIKWSARSRFLTLFGSAVVSIATAITLSVFLSPWVSSLISRDSEEAATGVIIVTLVLGTGGAAMFLANYIERRWLVSLRARAEKKAYEAVIRKQVGGFMEQAVLPFAVVLDFLNKTQLQFDYKIVDCFRRLHEDYGLGIYSLALPLAT